MQMGLVISIDEVGEKAWEAFARPFVLFSEDTKKNSQKVYRSGTEEAPHAISICKANI